MTPASDPDISKQHQSTHQKRDVETPLPFSTIHVGRIPGVLRDLQNSLRNSTSRSADLATLETLETQLDRSLITEQFAHIFIGAGRFEVVSSLEAQLWRAERREFIESESHKKQTGRATVSDALIIGGSLLPDFFPELQSASRVESRQAPLVEFANGELLPRVGSGVGWKNVFLLYQSDGTSNNPLVELMLQVDAVRRAGAAHITVVAPAFPYQRGDKRGADGTPIPAAAITRILEGQGVGRFVCFDPPTSPHIIPQRPSVPPDRRMLPHTLNEDCPPHIIPQRPSVPPDRRMLPHTLNEDCLALFFYFESVILTTGGD